MKIKETTLSEKGLNDNDYRNFLKIEVDGKAEVSFYDGEPEDANLSRDFSDCHAITVLMQKAFEAGKNGEEFDLECVEADELE